MDLLFFKLVLTPLFIAAATLAVRRWGFMLGGLFTGLPLTSGPICLFLAIEQGPAFAAHAALGTLLGMVALAVFCVAYARTARGKNWPFPMAAGFAAWLAAAPLLSYCTLNLAAMALAVSAFLLIAVKMAGPASPTASSIAAPSWDIPLRMITATAMVLFITGCADRLGPAWSGILAPFPVFTCIMAVFAQKQNGAAAAHRLLRGIIIGCFSAVSFFVVVGWTVEGLGIFASFILAALASLAASGVCLAALMRGDPAYKATCQEGRRFLRYFGGTDRP